MSEEFEGVGVIEEKSEAMSKKGKFWKYKIRLADEDFARTFNFFDYDAGTQVSVGDKVKLYWYENEADIGFGLQTFRNLKSIFKTNGTPDPVLSKLPDKELSKAEREVDNAIGGRGQIPSAKSTEIGSIGLAIANKLGGGGSPQFKSYGEGARFGMTVNNAVALCIAENKTAIKDIEDKFYLFKKLVDKLEEK